MPAQELADTAVTPVGVIRGQLQQQADGRTIHHASRVLRAAGGVTVQQVAAALGELREGVAIPRRERSAADQALATAVRWAESRPPNGVFGRFTMSFYFDRQRRRASWRFDVEVLSGYNLQRQGARRGWRKDEEPGMQTQAIAAEQTSRNVYQRPAPMPPWEIELTVRLEIPEQDEGDVGISSMFAHPLPPAWDDPLHQRLYQGVHSGLATVDAPFPDGGIGVHITHLRFFPPLESIPNENDVQRLGDALEALTAATITSLWNGIVSLGAPAIP